MFHHRRQIVAILAHNDTLKVNFTRAIQLPTMFLYPNIKDLMLD